MEHLEQNAPPALQAIDCIHQRPRPPHYPYSMRQLLHLPKRILNPPDGAIKMRSCTITPTLKISLQDVLDGKHLPPLSLMDFEEYLEYREMSIENLRFIQWVAEYTELYATHHARSTEGSSSGISPVLALSFTRAKKTFFDPDSDLAINLDRSLPRFDSPYPSPQALEPVTNEVRHHLRKSLDRFVHNNSQGNVETLRSIGSACFGFCIFLSGLAPVLIQVKRGTGSKALRLAAIPSFWMGLSVFLAATHGVCIILWMFGEGRQLRDFELARPDISAPQAHTTMMPHQLFLRHQMMNCHGAPPPNDPNKLELGSLYDEAGRGRSVYSLGAMLGSATSGVGDTDGSYIYPRPPGIDQAESTPGRDPNPSDIPSSTTYPPPTTANSAAPMHVGFDTSSIDPLEPAAAFFRDSIKSAAIAPFGMDTVPSSSKGGPFTRTLGQPPPRKKCSRKKRNPLRFPRVPILGPATKVHDTVILRSNWEVVMRSCILSALVTPVLVGFMWLIPERR